MTNIAGTRKGVFGGPCGTVGCEVSPAHGIPGQPNMWDSSDDQTYRCRSCLDRIYQKMIFFMELTAETYGISEGEACLHRAYVLAGREVLELEARDLFA